MVRVKRFVKRLGLRDGGRAERGLTEVSENFFFFFLFFVGCFFFFFFFFFPVATGFFFFFFFFFFSVGWLREVVC